MGLVRKPDRGQFTRPVQLGEVDRIPPVGLDAVTGVARDQRRSNDNASVPRCGHVPLNAVTARPGRGPSWSPSGTAIHSRPGPAWTVGL